MKKTTAPYTIGDALESMKGFLVKKIGDNFHFYHDFVMEITTYVFGSDYPEDTITHADASFLRKRVKLEDCKDQKDQCAIVLDDKYIGCLGKRLFIEIFGEHLLDGVLNPCLKNEKVRNVFVKELNLRPEKIKMLFEKKVFEIERHELYHESQNLDLSQLWYLNLRHELSPICAMIVFRHTQLSLYSLEAVKQMNAYINDISLFCAICCNGSLDLFNMFSYDQIKFFF